MTIKEGIRSLLNHLAPAGTFRRNVLQSFWRIILFVRREGLRGLVGKIPSSVRKLKNELKKPQGIFRSAYDLEDNSTVILYTDNPALFPQYQPRRSLSGCQKRWLGVSLISTTYNEKESVVPWLEGIHQQTRLPEEMVIVDGGSQDGTLELLQEYAQKSGLNMRVISRPGANIAAGRNVAITEAHNPIIACSDFGCRPRPDWLEKIVAPIEDRGGNLASDGTSAVQVSAGWFDAIHAGRTTRRLGWASLSDLDPQAFLPSSRSISFLKDAWQTVGGYPEWLTLTGEDTCFDFALKQACPRWAFVPEAVVEWQAPATPFDYWRKIDLWSVGDGEAGILTGYYWWSLVRILSAPLITLASTAIISLACAAGLVSWFVTLVMILAVWIAALAFPYKGVYRAVGSIPALVWEMGADYARLSGFFRGLQRRRQVTERRFTSTRGLVMILAVVPLEDTGGG